MTRHYPDPGSTSDWLKQNVSQSEALPTPRKCRVIKMKFLRSLLRRHFVGKSTLVASQDVSCLSRLLKFIFFLQTEQLSKE